MSLDSVGDPVSCSQLGGLLRSQAAQLLVVRAMVPELSSGVDDVDEAAVARRVAGDVQLLDVIIEQLDLTGTALQHHAQELAMVAEGMRRLGAAVSGAGLELDGREVVEPWGPSPAQTAEARRAVQPELQMRADRLASQLGRTRAAIRRSMQQSTELLERASRASRGSLGT